MYITIHNVYLISYTLNIIVYGSLFINLYIMTYIYHIIGTSGNIVIYFCHIALLSDSVQ